MAKPTWITDAGSLGSISEGVFYSQAIEATDADGDTVKYTFHSGKLPAGIQIKSTGFIEGIPTEVPERTESTFVVRATAGNDVADRTFTLFVDGDDAPTWITGAGQIANLFDGTFLNLQLQAVDTDNDIKSYKVIDGQLPPGIDLLEESGVLRGVSQPVPASLFDSTQVGWDGVEWDETQLWDFTLSLSSINKLYEFTVRVSDGVAFADRTFSIAVTGAGQKTDSDLLRADTTIHSADASDGIRPLHFITEPDLGDYYHENYYIITIDTVDPDGNLGTAGDINIYYALTSGTLPPGLEVDYNSGEIFGLIPRQITLEETYTFTIGATKRSDSSSFIEQVFTREFTMRVRGVGWDVISFNEVDMEVNL